MVKPAKEKRIVHNDTIPPCFCESVAKYLKTSLCPLCKTQLSRWKNVLNKKHNDTIALRILSISGKIPQNPLC